MSKVELSDALFAKLAGWDAVKQARSLLAAERVISSDWQPPLLRGMVREGSNTYRPGLIIKSDSDAENLCPCRDSRQRGIICAHAVAVGLHYVKSLNSPVAATDQKQPAKPSVSANPASQAKTRVLLRSTAGEEGDPLEISVILPPNLAEASTRGKVMLYLEGKRASSRAPLNALPLDTAFTLEEQDAALLDAVEVLNGGDTPAMMLLDSAKFADLLPKLVGHPRITLGKAQPIEVLADGLRVPIKANLEANGEIVLSLIQTAGNAPNRPTAKFSSPSGTWLFKGQTLQPLGLPAELGGLMNGSVRIPRSRVPVFLNLEWPRLLANGDVQANFALEDFVMEMAAPTFSLLLAGGLAVLRARLECFYGDQPANSWQNDNPWTPDPKSPLRYIARNLAAEQAAQARLLRCGFSGPDAEGFYHLKGQDPVLNFFARDYARFEKEWKVTLEERLEHTTRQNLERIEPRFQIATSGEQWFDLNIAYDTSGGEHFNPSDIQRLLLSGRSHTRLKNGKFALLDTGAVEELQETLQDCAPQQHAGGYRLGNTQAGFLESTLRQHSRWKMQAPAAWSQRAAQQSGQVKIEPPPLGELESVLRPYQKEGVAWLHFLSTNSFGGILADEMGLGKTLQVLALLEAWRTAEGGARDHPNASEHRAPHMVVCPTSLVFNWVAEAAKFTPSLRVLALHGPQRHALFAQIPDHDLVITSYALLRRDADRYRDLAFDTVVLDEAQHIKNRQAQNAQVVKAIRSQHRLVLTGTPLENSVLDLWSIFDFLMPGYLGPAQDFRERYELAIVRDKNVEAQNRLARRLRPFMLRRLKREVAKDLPEKIEQVSYCDMNRDQRALYQQVLEASRREIVNAVDANGLARSRMVVLTALLRLRQICCDLRLLKLPPATPEAATSTATPEAAPPALASGKMELFDELLEEVLDGGHRVLVFSQFTTMLSLLRDSLVAQDIRFCYLDGSTKDRAEVVGKFQSDPDISVFLISLKAGGVGLNLTGADTVIHFDPWWNPAVEAQATDRAHRIGQKRVVTSYKLITRGTVEEKILNLQTRKRALLEGMLGGEEQLAEALDWEEIQTLLAE